MNSFFRNSYLHLLIGIAAFLLLSFSSSFFTKENLDPTKFTTILHVKEAVANKTIDNLIEKDIPLDHFYFNEKYAQLNKEKGLTFYIFDHKELKFWTDRSVSFSADLKEFKGNQGSIHLQNGWYEYLLKKKNQKIYLALILIKHHYKINNKYLKDNFHPSFKVNNFIQITRKKVTKGATQINSNDGNYLFSLIDNKQKEHTSAKYTLLLLLLFFLVYLCIISFLSKHTRKIIALRKFSSIIVIAFIIISRLLLLNYHIFPSLFEIELFSPTIFAQSAFLPSLGDLFISSILFLVIVYYLSKSIRKINPYNKGIVFFIICCCAVAPIILANLITGLVANSNINFDINYLLQLNGYSFIGIGSITLFFIAIILLIKLIINHFLDKAFKRNQLITILGVMCLLAIIIGHFILGISAFLTIWILFVVAIFSFKTTPKSSFYRSAFLVFIVAITTTYAFVHLGNEKENITKEFTAKKLSKERDPVAEYLFEDLEGKITSDTLIVNNIAHYWENKSTIDKHLIDRYFKGYFSKYDINITSCSRIDTIFIESDNVSVNCLSFFEQKVEKEAARPYSLNKTLNLLYSENGESSYLAKLKVNPPSENDKNEWYLYIELLPKILSKAEGYPELLLNEKDGNWEINTKNYSYAKYKGGKLITNEGKFNYKTVSTVSYHFNDDGFFRTSFNNNNHLIYHADKNTLVIISTLKKTVFNYITTFSYLFIVTCLLVLLIGIFFKIPPFNWQFALSNFSTKIQLFIIGSIFLSFILFSWGTSYYLKKQNLEKNQTQLNEKVQSILTELEHKLGDKSKLNRDMFDEMTYYLVKFSNVFYTDVNLYDTSGRLLASSRPEVFDRGLVNKQMNPAAFKQIHVDKKSHCTLNENIGKLNYISTYVPFRNEKQKILAYMNLPYFAKQNELENELSAFYTALINIYGLLFLISTIIAVFFANYISEPVRMIKNKISALQLGKSYDLLEWQANDEIGALVTEYNKKVVELEKSANLLIKSERESAWREMAKQVAHEIKNPLTPMKLGIQQLQKVALDNPPDLNERIDRTAKTLIEQIETLTKIADEFSNFAKMPKTTTETFNLISSIETTIDLFKEENVSIQLTEKCDGKAIVVADKDQISRTFNNLIKNAIQAIPADVEGKIEVLINQELAHYVVQIKDNGIGISEDKKDKIFVPNFTTKSTGMGLGLAMVKNSIENANGTIWFETQENVGTTFFIKLPKQI